MFIKDHKIHAIGSCDIFAADHVIDGRGKLVMPGLINCHTHSYMSVFRNYADDLSFSDWLFGKIMPAEDRLTPEDAYWCNLLSCIEMIRTGTTCFSDMHMFPRQSVRAAMDSGMRAVVARGLVSERAETPAANRRLAEAFDEMASAQGIPLITFLLAPHAIYSCDEGFLRHVAQLAQTHALGLHFHLAESRAEVDNCQAAHGCSPVRYLDSLGFFAAPSIAAHCVQLTGEDISILKKRGVSVATNPISNMKLGNGFAPVSELLRAGINVCIGTDGVASNNSLNMFRELGMLAQIHKGTAQNAQALPAAQVLHAATLAGARALGLGDKTGSIEPGKDADLIMLDLCQAHMQPLNNPISGLVYSATGLEVETVIVRGNILMESRRLKTIDEQRVYAEMERIRSTLF